ncbi:MAG: hypothetical protein ACTSYI_02915, partial [Promethearchaeota archaeon]
ETKQETLLALGIYTPYATLAAYAGHDPKLWKRLNIPNPPVFGQDVWAQFHLAMQHMKLDYRIQDVESDDFLDRLLHNNSPKSAQHSSANENINNNVNMKPRMLIFVSSIFLSRRAQENLLEYVAKGGILCIFGDFPQYDENLQPCTTLRDAIPQLYERTGNIHRGTYHRGAIERIFELKIDPTLEITKNENEKRPGVVLYHGKNPLESGKDAKFYLLDFLSRALLQLNLNLRNLPVIDGEAIPYTELLAKIGGDILTPKVHPNTLKTINLLLRFLQKRGLYRKLDVTVRTDFIFRRKIRVHVFQHPTANIQHIFIFSMQVPWTLPVSIHIFQPESNFGLRIRTSIVGHTAQLLRIEDGKLTACIYNGVNPITHKYEPLHIKVNKHLIESTHALDLVYLSKEGRQEIYIAHGRFRGTCTITGLLEKKVTVRPRDHRIFP